MRLPLLAFATILAATAHAHAAPPTTQVAASEAVAGDDLTAAINATVRGDAACLPTCAGRRVAHKFVAPGATVELNALPPDAGDHSYRVVFQDRDHVYAWGDDDLGFATESCGMGKCVSETLDQVTITRARDLVWLRLRVHFTTHHSDPAFRAGDQSTRYDLVIGCKLIPGAAPRCARTQPDRWSASTTSIRGTTVTTHTATGRGAPVSTTEFTF
jgi:hypothetical protein